MNPAPWLLFLVHWYDTHKTTHYEPSSLAPVFRVRRCVLLLAMLCHENMRNFELDLGGQSPRVDPPPALATCNYVPPVWSTCPSVN